ncbi:hypothetical protein RhiirC2_801887 [Rhizophagus irregularis]|uniref:Uncharacterized protein n=1 Tax=Rhizophagus irregularis TaxID=588596 RepID=A0A2N1M1W1_9GLOM|nr:hypothetical protein RhiirC2_801887 [Rhizophagus irregularis]
MVSRSQTDILPNQSVHSRPAHSEKFISREGGAEAVSSAQVITLAPAIPVIASSSISPMVAYSILALLLIVVIWFAVRKKIWNSWSTNPREKFINREHRPECQA